MAAVQTQATLPNQAAWQAFQRREFSECERLARKAWQIAEGDRDSLQSDWRPVVIDNSIAFHPFVRPYRPLHRFARGPAQAVERLDPHVFRERLRRYLEKDEIQGFLARRDRLLALMAAARAEGRGDAFFEW